MEFIGLKENGQLLFKMCVTAMSLVLKSLVALESQHLNVEVKKEKHL